MHRPVRTLVLVPGVALIAILAAGQEPAPPEEISAARAADLGAELFGGQRAFANRGPSCVSCHDAATRKRIEGTTFGPDLTRACRRLGGARHLAAWLAHPPASMMRATYEPAPLRPDEIRALAAYLDYAASGKGTVPGRARGGTLEPLQHWREP